MCPGLPGSGRRNAAAASASGCGEKPQWPSGGTDEVGPAVPVGAVNHPGDGTWPPHRRLDPCPPPTMFGAMTGERPGSWRPGATTGQPWADQLPRPRRSFSDERPRCLVQAAGPGPLEEAMARGAEATGVTVPQRRAEPLVPEAARPRRNRERWWRPSPPHPHGPGLPSRASRASVAWALRHGGGQGHRRCPARPEYTRGWASLLKGQAGGTSAVVQELRRRDAARQQPGVGLTEGERAWPQSVTRRLRGGPVVLDLQPGWAKLGRAGSAGHEAGSPKALAGVQERTWRWRHGAVSRVVQGRRRGARNRPRRGQKRQVGEAVADSGYRHRHRRRDEEDRRQGWPIAPGVVEGAWKNVIKERRERSGRRGTSALAEALLKLRATSLSNDVEAYWAFHRGPDHERGHPPGSWRPAPIIEEQ